MLAAGPVEETPDAVELKRDVSELVKALQARRNPAQEGEILGGEVAEEIRSSLAKRLSRDDGPALVARIMDVQPDMAPPAINARYPSEDPRARMPAEVLRALPRIPDALSYRFVGHHLVLLDRPTGLVVDVLRDVLPRPDRSAARGGTD